MDLKGKYSYTTIHPIEKCFVCREMRECKNGYCAECDSKRIRLTPKKGRDE